VAAHLVVLSPHKKPVIGEHTGWSLIEHKVIQRVHVWMYESLNLQKQEELGAMLNRRKQAGAPDS
jgi:hypothetical protein